MPYEIEQIVDDHNLCGEGPLWDWRRNVLVWNDLSASLVFEYEPATRERKTINRGLMAAGMALHADGGYLFAGSTGLHLWRAPNEYHTLLSHHGDEALCFNDILADSQGRLYAGTYYWDAAGMLRPGKLYLIETDCTLHVVDEGVLLTNGLGLSPDGRTLYFADSARCCIWSYEVESSTGMLCNRKAFVDVPVMEGLPDGLTVDGEGNVWCALWYGSQVVCYDPKGIVRERLQFPVPQVTSVEFAGTDLKDLYVTTAAEAWHNDIVPNYDVNRPNLGGALYRVRLNQPGRREHLARLTLKHNG